jgi:hypothetical protein
MDNSSEKEKKVSKIKGIVSNLTWKDNVKEVK